MLQITDKEKQGAYLQYIGRVRRPYSADPGDHTRSDSPYQIAGAFRRRKDGLAAICVQRDMTMQSQRGIGQTPPAACPRGRRAT